ncbi:hypothetical protein LPJ59_002186 [Coemansia sp. RSA 2399]|nr:hypothetical protein LPJ59_002186 [Coemansia sp. RSA 2399]
MHLDTDSYIELAEDSKRFIHIGPTGSFSYTINAPNLKYLRIKLNPLIFSILANTRLPRNLKMLAIKDKNGLIFNLHNVCTKRLVDDVFSKAAEFGDNCLSYTDIIRSLFGNNNMAKQIECVVDRQVRLVDFKDMDKLYFTSLTVRLSISFAVLMALISRMPELVDVVADKVTFPVDAEGVVSLSELESETRPYFGSLPTTIKRMHLTTDDGQHADERTREYLFGFVRKNTKALRDMKLV